MSKGGKIQLLVIDVDGTMTDAGIYYDQNGNELKKFCTKDAAGFFAAKKSGIEIMVLTGRERREQRAVAVHHDKSAKQN